MAGETDDFQSDNEMPGNNENLLLSHPDKSSLPDFKLNIQNPVPPKMLLLLIIIQLITSIALILIIYFK